MITPDGERDTSLALPGLVRAIVFTTGTGDLLGVSVQVPCGFVVETQFDQRDDLETLSVRRREADGAVVVRVAGEIDMHTGPQVEEAIGESLNQVAVHSVVIDLNAVTFFSSTGVATLVNAAKQADELDKVLRIVVGGNRAVRRPLEATGMDIALGVCER